MDEMGLPASQMLRKQVKQYHKFLIPRNVAQKCRRWQATGYKNAGDEVNLAQLAAHILLTAVTRTLHREYLNGLDEFISIPHQSFCYDFVSDWFHSDDLQALYEINREVEAETRLYQRFSKLNIEDLWDTECFPCVNEEILTKMMTEIKDQIIQVEVIAQTA